MDISVIIPVYNGADLIGGALDSVLAQTRPGVEAIVIDDGSTDATPGILASFADRYPGRVRCLRTENRGPGAARNEGLRAARGTFVALLDGDDIWLPEKLERQWTVMRDDPDAGMVYCDNYFVDRGGREIQGYRRTVTLHEGSIAPQLFQHCFILTSSVLIRRECVRKTGGFREDIRVGEDYDFFLRLSCMCRVRFLNQKLFLRRVLPDSLSSRDYTVNARNDIMVLREFLRKHPVFSAGYHAQARQRLGEYHFSLGYYLLRSHRNARAALELARSLIMGVKARRLKCLALCAFPYGAVHALKRFFQAVSSGRA